MSLPPTNLPSMYTCGIVGQLENSLMPSRTSGSVSTLTVSNSAPARLSASTARDEKPHCGKLFVPFMNTTTRLFLMVLSIFCLVSSFMVTGSGAACRSRG